MKIAGVIIMGIITIMIINLVGQSPAKLDQQTIDQCHEYANRDHEKEIAPERYSKLGADFFQKFDWYTSCINHQLHPVAK